MSDKTIKFKLLVVKSSEKLESAINTFIKGKTVSDLKVQYMMGSHYSTHQVYITYYE